MCGHARAVTISPDGKHVYVAGADPIYGAVTVFSRDLEYGTLGFVEAEKHRSGAEDGLQHAIDVAVSPDGKSVYVASSVTYGQSIAAFSRNAESGEISFIETYPFDDPETNTDYQRASSVTLSPDSKNVYVTLDGSNVIEVFSRDLNTGKLELIEFWRDHPDAINYVDSLTRPSDAVVSPDGSNVYVTSISDDSVTVFERNKTNGRLSLIESHKDGEGGVDGLNSAQSIAISSDGSNVYIAGGTDFALAVFSRDYRTGRLNFVELQRDGIDGVEGLDGPESVTVSPDGKNVYVVSSNDDALAVFSRNGNTGELNFVEAQVDGVDGVEGLTSASGVAASPDSAHVYTTSWLRDAITVFCTTNDCKAPAPTPSAALSINPPASEIAVGESVVLEVKVSGVVDLYNTNISLTFDPAVLEVVDDDGSKSGTQITSGSCPYPSLVVANSADNVSGSINYVVSSLQPASSCSGTGVVASITMTGLNVGESALQFEFVVLKDTFGNLITTSTEDGSLQVIVDDTIFSDGFEN